MVPNPYSTPLQVNGELKPDESPKGCVAEAGWLVLPPLFCTIAGFAWYIVAATIVESLVMPNVEPCKYPYGGPAIFLCLALSTFYGLLIGIASSVFGSKQSKYGGAALVVAATIATTITVYWWFQFENASECSSKYVLFYPLYALNITTGIAGLYFALHRMRSSIGG